MFCFCLRQARQKQKMRTTPEEEQADTNELAQWNNQKSSTLNFPRMMYCMGATARIDNVIQNYYLNPFLLDIVGLKPSLTGNVLLIKQVWDAITDPMVGYASDNLDSRFGRRKPFVYASSLFLWAAWIMLWLQFDALDDSQMALFFYYLLTLMVFNLMSTSQAVPYRALLQDIAPTYGIRTKMVAMQEMVAMFSFMVAVFVQGQVSEMFEYPDSGETNYKLGYIVCALIFAPIVGFTRVFTSAFVTEKPLKSQRKYSEADVILPRAEEQDDEEGFEEEDEEDDGVEEVKSKSTCGAAIRFLVIWKSALAFKDFSLLSLAWMIANVLLSLVTANLLLYVKYYLGNAQYGTYMIVCLQLGIAISLPVWALVIRAIGKKKALFCGCFCLSCCLLGGLFLQEGQALILLILLPFCGCCAGSLYICLTAMQPDCVEAYYLKHQQRYNSFSFDFNFFNFDCFFFFFKF